MKSSYTVWKWTNSLCSDSMAKEIQLWNTKDTLCFVDNQSVGGEQLEKLSEVFKVFFV